MGFNVSVFDISSVVTSNTITTQQKDNILKLFDELTTETHLITNCYLDLTSLAHEESPIHYYNETDNKNDFDFNRIASDLLMAECKVDNTRNSTIREGLLFIKSNEASITIMKLEKLTVIDLDTYEFKSQLGKEKDYFKVCIFNGDYDDIKIIDKNRTAAKYWYQKFLGLTRKRTHEDNTIDVIEMLSNDSFYKKDILERENYNEIKRFTEYYLFDNKKFDKSDLFHELNSSGLVEIKKEDDLFSIEAEIIDSDFDISAKVINDKYQRKIQVSDEIIISTKNYLESIRDNQLMFDEKNKKIVVFVEDNYLNSVREYLEIE